MATGPLVLLMDKLLYVSVEKTCFVEGNYMSDHEPDPMLPT